MSPTRKRFEPWRNKNGDVHNIRMKVTTDVPRLIGIQLIMFSCSSTIWQQLWFPTTNQATTPCLLMWRILIFPYLHVISSRQESSAPSLFSSCTRESKFWLYNLGGNPTQVKATKMMQRQQPLNGWDGRWTSSLEGQPWKHKNHVPKCSTPCNIPTYSRLRRIPIASCASLTWYFEVKSQPFLNSASMLPKGINWV